MMTLAMGTFDVNAPLKTFFCCCFLHSSSNLLSVFVLTFLSVDSVAMGIQVITWLSMGMYLPM